MLPTNDFLRNLPKVLLPEDVLRLETLIHTSDICQLALNRIRSTANVFDVRSASQVERVSLISDCWLIVDQTHVARQILKALTKGNPSPETSRYLDLSEPASRLRNRMDHLASAGVKNRANMKGRRAPTYGVVSFFRPSKFDENQIIDCVRGELIFVFSGSIPDQETQLMDLTHYESGLPIGNVLLDAFEQRFPVSHAVEMLHAIVVRISICTKAQVMAQLEAVGKLEQLQLTQSMNVHLAFDIDLPIQNGPRSSSVGEVPEPQTG